MNVPPELLSFLKREKEFVAATHINPDGDALGSSIALAMALESLGKKTTLYCKDAVPDFYGFLPGRERFTDRIEDIKSPIQNFLLLDCNDLSRIGIEKVDFVSSAIIDHHETARDFGDIKWINPRSPATGIMIFYLIKELGVKMTKEIAINLYTAIAIDTGTFRYGNTTAEALRIAAELVDAGADPYVVAENLYETWSENRFRLLMKILETLELHDGIAFTTVTLDMFNETGTSADDTENIPGFSRMLGSVKVSALFREVDTNYYKVSLRSKGKEINVAKVAEKFGGGGHRSAAGYRIKADLKSAKELLLKEIPALPSLT